MLPFSNSALVFSIVFSSRRFFWKRFCLVLVLEPRPDMVSRRDKLLAFAFFSLSCWVWVKGMSPGGRSPEILDILENCVA